MIVTYRPIAVIDHGFCIRVHHLSMRAYVEPLWGWNELLQDKLALEFLNHREANHEIALVMQTPIGYLSYQNRPEVLLLNKLHLHPKHQGQGYGAQIMLRLAQLAGSSHKSIELSVLTTNPRARKFYERHGFVVVQETAEKVRMLRSD
jgi:GNAT superfamily N-acetyltransferase